MQPAANSSKWSSLTAILVDFRCRIAPTVNRVGNDPFNLSCAHVEGIGNNDDDIPRVGGNQACHRVDGVVELEEDRMERNLRVAEVDSDQHGGIVAERVERPQGNRTEQRGVLTEGAGI